MSKLLLALLVILSPCVLRAQNNTITARRIIYGATLPATCSPSVGMIFFKTAAPIGPVYCSATNTWTSMAGGGGGGASTCTGTAGQILTADGSSSNCIGATTAAGILTFLGAPTSANLAAALTTSTGTGLNVFNNTPTLITPALGVAGATSLAVNGCTIGADALCVGSSNLFHIANNGNFYSNSFDFGYTHTGLNAATANFYGWSASSGAANAPDTTLCRQGAGVVEIGSGASCGTGGTLEAVGTISAGTKFTASGCSNTTTVGGATAGQFASGTTGACTVVITINGATGLTAPNGWSCFAADITAGHLVDFTQTATSTTTCTVSATTTSGDTVVWHAIGY